MGCFQVGYITVIYTWGRGDMGAKYKIITPCLLYYFRGYIFIVCYIMLLLHDEGGIIFNFIAFPHGIVMLHYNKRVGG